MFELISNEKILNGKKDKKKRKKERKKQTKQKPISVSSQKPIIIRSVLPLRSSSSVACDWSSLPEPSVYIHYDILRFAAVLNVKLGP